MAAVIELMIVDSEASYQEALARMDGIFDADPDTPEGYEAKMLTKAIVDYEEATDEPLSAQADAIDVLKFFMDQQDLRQADLVPYVGGKSVVSQILNRKRSLTVEMIRRLSAGLHIPVGAFFEPPRTQFPDPNQTQASQVADSQAQGN